MSFLADLFKKKDAAFYRDKAKKALDAQAWVDARDHAEDGLEKSPQGDVEKELHLILKEARRAICDMNREEAGYSADAGELERAMDLLVVAMENAPSEGVRRDIQREMDRLERRSVARERGRVAQELGRRHAVGSQDVTPMVADQAEPEHAIEDLFEVYLAGLVPEVAERYRSLGPDFAAAFVALNHGDVKHALTLMRKVDPPEESKVYLSFERARVALMLGMTREARALITEVATAHGYGPIYLEGSPSVAQLEAEALLAAEEHADALVALRKGLSLDPENNNLIILEIQMMIGLGELDPAVKKIEGRLKKNSKDRNMYLLRHQLELARKDDIAAANALERGMSTCCASGNCGAADRDIPRTLIRHYMRMEQNSKRVDELLSQLFRSQGGQGEWIDLYLRARFYKWQGDDERGHKNWEAAVKAIPEDHPSFPEVRSLYS